MPSRLSNEEIAALIAELKETTGFIMGSDYLEMQSPDPDTDKLVVSGASKLIQLLEEEQSRRSHPDYIPF